MKYLKFFGFVIYIIIAIIIIPIIFGWIFDKIAYSTHNSSVEVITGSILNIIYAICIKVPVLDRSLNKDKDKYTRKFIILTTIIFKILFNLILGIAFSIGLTRSGWVQYQFLVLAYIIVWPILNIIEIILYKKFVDKHKLKTYIATILIANTLLLLSDIYTTYNILSRISWNINDYDYEAISSFDLAMRFGYSIVKEVESVFNSPGGVVYGFDH